MRKAEAYSAYAQRGIFLGLVPEALCLLVRADIQCSDDNAPAVHLLQCAAVYLKLLVLGGSLCAVEVQKLASHKTYSARAVLQCGGYVGSAADVGVEVYPVTVLRDVVAVLEGAQAAFYAKLLLALCGHCRTGDLVRIYVDHAAAAVHDDIVTVAEVQHSVSEAGYGGNAHRPRQNCGVGGRRASCRAERQHVPAVKLDCLGGGEILRADYAVLFSGALLRGAVGEALQHALGDILYIRSPLADISVLHHIEHAAEVLRREGHGVFRIDQLAADYALHRVVVVGVLQHHAVHAEYQCVLLADFLQCLLVEVVKLGQCGFLRGAVAGDFRCGVLGADALYGYFVAGKNTYCSHSYSAGNSLALHCNHKHAPFTASLPRSSYIAQISRKQNLIFVTL